MRLVFAIAQYATSNFVSVPLADVVASLLSAAAVVLLVRVWQPSRPVAARARRCVAGGAADYADARIRRARRSQSADSRADIVQAYAPYAIIIAVFVICQITAVKKLLDKATVKFEVAGAAHRQPEGKAGVADRSSR